jgi:hypothetical protein
MKERKVGEREREGKKERKKDDNVHVLFLLSVIISCYVTKKPQVFLRLGSHR